VTNHAEAPFDGALVDLCHALSLPGSAAVLVAPPGAGKTTLAPLALLREGWASSGRIVVLEPRRLATRAAARRMAALLGEQVGETVGYRTRDERRVGRSTRIEVVTEGILTRRLQQDPSLPGTSLVIFDEVHERNLQTDLGLAFALDAKRALRPDLRVLAMSATIDGQRFAELLRDGDEPVRVIEGGERPHPVEVHWFPRKPNDRLEPAIVTCVQTALRRDLGDVLVFLPGAGEIRRTADLLRDAGLVGSGIDIRPLYGMLAAEEQDAALRPSTDGRRRVVLATDIAETSLTVEGVRIVVDGGLARSPRYDAHTGLTRLQTVNISRASAEQRAGRAGREAPGVVYRLWSRGEHATRRPSDQPEIAQVDLCAFVLELAAWGTTDPSTLPFLDGPPARTVDDARQLLQLLGALDEHDRITDLGRSMNALPLHPRLARMCVLTAAGDDSAETIAACCVAALLEERDVLRGRADELPCDLATRLGLLADPSRRHAAADGRALQNIRRRARELCERLGLGSVDLHAVDDVEPARSGAVLALAYPDRLAVRRSQPGRFQLRSGGAAWVPKNDPIGLESFIVAADLDGDRKESRIRVAAPIDAADVGILFGASVEERTTVDWDRGRDELVCRVERRLGGLVLDELSRKPDPGDEVTTLLVQRVRDRGLRALTWTDDARSLRERTQFVRSERGEPWPDWSDEALLGSLDEWLSPFLLFARGRADLEGIDVLTVLRAQLDRTLTTQLVELAPTHLVVPSGRRIEVDYSGDVPSLSVAVQDMFGSKDTPRVAMGDVAVRLELLSPAGRPVQITQDLAGFWAGSWHEVRKEMAGRYPKHSWPLDPVNAIPPRRHGGR
jgi:ATP-dependent helicase HrpB